MDKNSKCVIISPSGNFYGSEQVLFDFLNASDITYKVYVPNRSILEKKLRQEHKHIIKTFQSLPLLYFKLAIVLIFKRFTLYVNEGGHVKYLKLLAKILPNRKFVLQIRLLSDTHHSRLKNLPSNIQILCVSKFIANNIPSKYNPLVLHDPFNLPEPLEKKKRSKFNIGFIGRVTPTKGLNEASLLLKELEAKKIEINIYFFGSIERDKTEVNEFILQCKSYQYIKVDFKGFVDNKKAIYKDLNLVIHLNKEEAFPRIALESWAYGVPLIGFDAGGLGEINRLLQVSDFLLDNNENWLHQIHKLIQVVKENYPASEISKAQNIISKQLDLTRFTGKLEELIS
jgi:glycosyltransferase involved in cell wall biosynthesis